MLKVVKTDANGKLVANFSAKNAPAFSLNKYTVTNSQGNDYVHHFPNIEFHAKDIKLSVEAATVYIRWDAIVYNKNDIQFEIWKGEGGHDQLERIAIIKPSNDLNNSYVFDDIYKAANSYELRIVKDGIVERYATSRLADATNLSGVKVYPTVIKDNFFIDLDETGRTIYEVYNLSGQLLKKGKLNDQYNQVYLADYPVGSYVLKVSHNGTIQRFQLTKN